MSSWSRRTSRSLRRRLREAARSRPPRWRLQVRLRRAFDASSALPFPDGSQDDRCCCVGCHRSQPRSARPGSATPAFPASSAPRLTLAARRRGRPSAIGPSRLAALRERLLSIGERVALISVLTIVMGSLFVTTYSLALGDRVPHVDRSL